MTSNDLEALHELETTFAPFTARVDDDEDGSFHLREFDPINLVFPGQTLDDVAGAFERSGWVEPRSGAVHSLRLDKDRLVEQSAQYAFYDEDDRRYHIRLWALLDPAVLAAAHHEREFVAEGRVRHHVDAGFETAEAFIVGHLVGRGEFVRARRAFLDEQARRQRADGNRTGWRGWENHPRASVLYRPGLTS